MRGVQAHPKRCQAYDLAIVFCSFSEIQAVDRRDQGPAFSSFPPPRQARRASGERLLTWIIPIVSKFSTWLSRRGYRWSRSCRAASWTRA